MYQSFILNALEKHRAKKPLSAHMPGHKNGTILNSELKEAWGEKIFSYDITELNGLDDLHHPSGIIRQSQDQAAAIFHAKEAHYLINGSTVGLHAAILSIGREQEIFIPRHCHRSIYYGLLLAHAKPIYLEVALDPTWGLPLGVAPETLKKAIIEHPNCHNLLIVNPTYQGITWQNEELLKIAKENNLCTIIDEAHGAHLSFHEALPSSMLTLGADLVVQSWHKTLPAVTGTSCLLVGNSYTGNDVAIALDILQSTSPSYLMLSALESASIYMAEWGESDIDHSLGEINRLSTAISQLQTISILHDPSWRQDPFKLNLSSSAFSGGEFAQELEKRQIYVEMSEANSVLLLLPLKITPDYTQKILDSLIEIEQSSLAVAKRPLQPPFYTPQIPPMRYPLADSIWRTKKSVPLNTAIGCVCGEFILRYPPGIPLVVPGEIITADIASLLQSYPNYQTLTILDESK